MREHRSHLHMTYTPTGYRYKNQTATVQQQSLIFQTLSFIEVQIICLQNMIHMCHGFMCTIN